MKFQNKIKFLIIFMSLLKLTQARPSTINYSENYFGFKYGFQYDHIILNIGRNKIHDKYTIGYGAFYRSQTFESLNHYKIFRSKATFYGLNFSYVPGKVHPHKITLKFKNNLIAGVAFTKHNYSQNSSTTKSVFLITNYFGPEIGIKISKSISLRAFICLGIGYGTHGRGNGDFISYGEGGIIDFQTQIISFNILHR